MRLKLNWMLASLFVWAGCPGQASAHLVNSGLGPFYDGVAHFFVTPEDILVVVAIAFLAGLGGKHQGSVILLLLPIAWLAGAVAGRMTHLAAGLPMLSAALLSASGALVACDLRLPLRFVAVFALTIGMVHGFFNGAALAETNSRSLSLVGIVCAVFVVVALVAGQVVSLQKDWARITVRVVGSWIGAIGLLMLGWAAR